MAEMTERQARLCAAMEMLLQEVGDRIEEKIPDWLDKNPYWEIDGDDGRPERCPRTTRADAREDLYDEFISSGDDIGLYNFFDFVASELTDKPMKKNNPYRGVYHRPQPKLTPYEETIKRTNDLCANIFNDILGVRND